MVVHRQLPGDGAPSGISLRESHSTSCHDFPLEYPGGNLPILAGFGQASAETKLTGRRWPMQDSGISIVLGPRGTLMWLDGLLFGEK